MKKIGLPIVAAMALLGTISSATFAQESNRGENYSAYMPEVAAFNKLLGQLPKNTTILTKEGIAASRNGMKAFIPKSTLVKPKETKIPVAGGEIALRIFKADTILAVVLDIHGGGWVQDAAALDDGFNDEMARICKVAVVSVDYRAAPESPFPTCINDCKAAAKWLVANAKQLFGTDKILITGQSAGAHLSALVTLYIRDSLHAASMVRGVVLQYGCFDLGRSPSERLTTDTTLILSKKSMAEIYTVVFGGWDGEKLRQPEYSPLYANLTDLPPAYFMVGTNDPLLDDTNFMESRWRSAGNKTFLAVYPLCPHGFNIFPTKLAKLANAHMFGWMKGLIGG